MNVVRNDFYLNGKKIPFYEVEELNIHDRNMERIRRAGTRAVYISLMYSRFFKVRRIIKSLDRITKRAERLGWV